MLILILTLTDFDDQEWEVVEDEGGDSIAIADLEDTQGITKVSTH